MSLQGVTIQSYKVLTRETCRRTLSICFGASLSPPSKSWHLFALLCLLADPTTLRMLSGGLGSVEVQHTCARPSSLELFGEAHNVTLCEMQSLVTETLHPEGSMHVESSVRRVSAGCLLQGILELGLGGRRGFWEEGTGQWKAGPWS